MQTRIGAVNSSEELNAAGTREERYSAFRTQKNAHTPIENQTARRRKRPIQRYANVPSEVRTSSARVRGGARCGAYAWYGGEYCNVRVGQRGAGQFARHKYPRHSR